jgi:2-polyprenyl-3-methyl-5-hydroxy-6-metoxy-1,4-benzoquinol methylase
VTSELLSSRFENDAKSIKSLNELQQRTRDEVSRKVREGVYEFEEVLCPVCDNKNEFNGLSEKDRYGLYHPVKICRDCGLVQTNPRMTEEAYGKFYNSEYRLLYNGAKDWTESLFQSQKNRADDVYEYLEKSVEGGVQGADVLDIGCGTGGMLSYFQDEGHRVAGCDLDEDAVSYANEQGVPLQRGSVEDLELSWEPDLVILSHVVEHFLAPVDELRDIRELCHENTKVYIELPGIKRLSPFDSYYNADFLRQLQNAHTYYFTATTLENLLNKSGFESVTVDESIRGVFTPSNSISNDFTSDYAETMERLNKIERWKQWGVSPVPTPHDLYTHPSFVSLLKKTGVHPYAEKVYNKLH